MSTQSGGPFENLSQWQVSEIGLYAVLLLVCAHQLSIRITIAALTSLGASLQGALLIAVAVIMVFYTYLGIFAGLRSPFSLVVAVSSAAHAGLMLFFFGVAVGIESLPIVVGPWYLITRSLAHAITDH